MDIPKMVKVVDIRDENAKVRTLFIDYSTHVDPGQFLMVWVPGIGEKPFAVSYNKNGIMGISVAKVGELSRTLHEMKCGSIIGIRGPYGKGFRVHGTRMAIVAGGYGAAPLALLAENASAMGKEVFFIIGARSKDDLLFVERVKSCGNVLVCTDDGSAGRRGFTTDALRDLMKEERVDLVCTCGPEVMMKKVFELCEKNKVECQASFERYMKCGFGICGQCVIGGYRVCKDGPVFSTPQLRELDDFGLWKFDVSGKKVRI